VRQILEPANLAEFRKNVAALNNRAIFEIPEMLAKLLGPSEEAAEPAATTTPIQTSSTV
jgi:1,2-diacylglycerol 3-beta-galactosyltransferase